MTDLEAELADARELSVEALADAIQAIGFECTRCGACCAGEADDPHTATVFPDEVRTIADGTDEWRDVARPMPFGLDDDGTGETFEWALATTGCGDCAFYDDGEPSPARRASSDGTSDGGERTDGSRTSSDRRADGSEPNGPGSCTVHDDRPLICETYPFSVDLAGSTPTGAVVDAVELRSPEGRRPSADAAGTLRVHECEGLGRDISRSDAEALAGAVKRRAVRELEEAIALRDRFEPADPGPGGVVVHDSEGAKRPDGTPLER